MVIKPLLLCAFLLVSTLIFGQNQIGDSFIGTSKDERLGTSLAISGNGNRLVIGASGLGNAPNENGYVKIYDKFDNQWVQVGNTLIGKYKNSRFGESVDISENGDQVVISAIFDGPNQNGYVEVYELVSEDWVQKGQTLISEGKNAFFGSSLAMSDDGNTIAIGSPFFSNISQNAGQLLIYEYIDNKWVLKGEVINGMSSEGLGRSVSLSNDGKFVSVSGLLFGGGGSVKSFSYNGERWVEYGDPIISTFFEDNFGTAIALSDDGVKLLVGAHQNTQKEGYVETYLFENNNWVKSSQILRGENYGSRFGRALSMSADGNRLVIGSPNFEVDWVAHGKVAFYKWNNNIWEIEEETIVGYYPNDGYGSVVRLSSDRNTLIMSAPNNSNQGHINGGVVFVHDLSTLSNNPIVDENHYRVHPNPSNNELMLEYPGPQTISIFDIFGNSLLTTEVLTGRLDISFLNSGTYILEQRIHNKSIHNKFIKL